MPERIGVDHPVRATSNLRGGRHAARDVAPAPADDAGSVAIDDPSADLDDAAASAAAAPPELAPETLSAEAVAEAAERVVAHVASLPSIQVNSPSSDAEHASGSAVLVRFTVLLSACLGPAVAFDSPPRAPPATASSVSTLPLNKALGVITALRKVCVGGVHVASRTLHIPGVTVATTASTARSALLTCLDAAQATLMLMCAPGVDPRLVSDEALSDVVSLARAALSKAILPCYDALDPVWSTLGGSDAEPAVASEVSESAPKKQKRRKSAARALSEADSEQIDVEADDDGSREAAGGDRAALMRPPSSKVPRAALTAAASASRQIVLRTAALLDRLSSLVTSVSLSHEQALAITDVAFLAATQTNAGVRSGGGGGGSGGAAHAASASAGSGSSPEGALLNSGMSLTASVFMRMSTLRPNILRTLATAHVRLTIAANLRPAAAFGLSGGLPRPTAVDVAGSTDSLVPPHPSICACTALALHLVHAAAAPPTQEELALADASDEPLPLRSPKSAPKSVGKGKKGSTGKQQTPLSEPKSGKSAAEPPPQVDLKSGKKGRKSAAAAEEKGAVTTSRSSRKGGGKGEEAVEPAAITDLGAAAAAVKTPSASPVAPSPRPPPPASEGISEPARLATAYVSALVRASDASLGGTGGGLGASDEDEPRLLLKRFAADLCTAVEAGPEWPAAELMLATLVGALSSRLPASSVSADAAGAHSSAVSTAALGAMGPSLGRVLRLRAFASRNSLALPSSSTPGSAPTDKAVAAASASSSAVVVQSPSKEGTATFACECGRGLVKGACAIACDVCRLFFHVACVHLAEDTLPEWWSCDSCRLRAVLNDAHAALGMPVPSTAPLPPSRERSILRLVTLNYVTERAHDNIFARMARRFLIAKWSSAAMTARDVPLRCVSLRGEGKKMSL
jgi:hypothetical protein